MTAAKRPRRRWSPGKRRLVVAAAIVVTGAVALSMMVFLPARVPDLNNRHRIETGALLYAKHCASCHGANLEGQPDWRTPLANGRYPAPPHDDSGHTWHHRPEFLFEITRSGMKPPFVPSDYMSDMPGFGAVLSDDEIWDVLAFIRSRWSDSVRTKNDRISARALRVGMQTEPSPRSETLAGVDLGAAPGFTIASSRRFSLRR